ncbi:hypothetical protein RB2150_02264 [Rhodobacteraceae bacterium HTCC2150]|nr:hypothetical protein RB2150_02264 [Rhodobacteraceae bacterium HTCC2150]
MSNDHDEDDIASKRPSRRLFVRLRGNFLAGLIVVVPVVLTIWLIWTVTGLIDGWVLPFVPDQLQPSSYVAQLLQNIGINIDPDLRVNIRGVGVIIFLIFTIIVGWMAKGFMGRTIVRFGERLVDRTPVVRSVYNGLKQLIETAVSQSTSSFDQACLIEYPRKGIWAIAFISTKAKGEIFASLPGEEDIFSVFLPTTPNPTSGFLLFLPRSEVIVLDMSVENAAKLVISAGLVYPNAQDPTQPVLPGIDPANK